jgi:hypothetical protein
LDVTYTSDRVNDPESGSPDLRKLFALLQDFEREHKAAPKWFEMSHETYYAIEAKFSVMSRTEPCNTLWGIMIVFNEALPLNEIKPVYHEERTRAPITLGRIGVA